MNENKPDVVVPTTSDDDVAENPANGCVNASYDVIPDPLDRHVLLIAKHPPVRLNPTLDVEVAEPAIVRPDSVVVPNPELETLSHGAVVEPTHSEKFVPDIESIARVADGVVVPIPTFFPNRTLPVV